MMCVHELDGVKQNIFSATLADVLCSACLAVVSRDRSSWRTPTHERARFGRVPVS